MLLLMFAENPGITFGEAVTSALVAWAVLGLLVFSAWGLVSLIQRVTRV